MLTRGELLYLLACIPVLLAFFALVVARDASYQRTRRPPRA